jgi:hypothetical protein
MVQIVHRRRVHAVLEKLDDLINLLVMKLPKFELLKANRKLGWSAYKLHKCSG